MTKPLAYMVLGCAVSYVIVDARANKKMKKLIHALKSKMM